MKKLLKKSKVLVRLVRKSRNLFKKNSAIKNDRDPFKDMRKLCDSIGLKNPTFIDGGAHNGSTILKIRDEGFTHSKIFAFEPIPEAAQGIYSFNDDEVTVIEKALGDKDGTVDFNVNNRAVTSSILTPAEVEKYHPGVATLARKISVPCARIDTLVASGAIEQPDIIKLDLQGYELKALKGAEKILAGVKMILCEAEFVQLYKGQPLYHDIAVYLQAQGSSLFNLYGLGSHSDGQIVSADALFIKI